MPLLESPHPFSQSRIWQLQREYFSQAGIEAWRSGDVPHYVTSNPVAGKTYAELVLAFLRDLSLQDKATETVYLLELGAGHGRLCYHFFKHFEKFYEQSAIPLPPFCYVLSDFTETNLAFWQDHPRLQPYIGKGWLDFSLFDAEDGSVLNLQQANISIRAQSLGQPLIVIGNYFFDTIPQELFLIEDQKVARCLISLNTDADAAGLEPAALLKAVELEYSYESLEEPAYPADPVLNDLVDYYRGALGHTHMLLPHTGIRCIKRLRTLSQKGLLLLSADKGRHLLSDLDNCPAPKLTTHGSFSLSVNYHAFREYCRKQGGLDLFPRYHHASLDLGCLLLLDDAPAYRETAQAYERFVNDYGPDDYFSLKKLIEQHYDTLSCRDIMSTLRLSGYDARIFLQMSPRLFDVLPEISDNERWSLLQAVTRVWDTYYPLGESRDLAFDLGHLLFELGFYNEAILYFELSIKIYCRSEGAVYNIALCHCLVGNFAAAAPLIDELRAINPDNEDIDALVERF